MPLVAKGISLGDDMDDKHDRVDQMIRDFIDQYATAIGSDKAGRHRERAAQLLRNVLWRQLDGPAIEDPEDWIGIEDTQYFDCACRSDEHAIAFRYISSPDSDPEVYASVFLENGGGRFPVLGRLWRAIKYVLGYKCRYGHFDCFILRQGDLDRLIELLQKYKADMGKCKEEYERGWRSRQCERCQGNAKPEAK